MKICDVTQFYSPVSGGVKRYISEKRRYIQDSTTDEHHLIVPGSVTRSEHEGRLHTYTIRSPRLDFFSKYPSRYRIILNTKLVLDLLDEIRPDLIESGDPYHLAWTSLQSGQEQRIPVFGFYHSHFPDAYLRTALKFGGTFIRDAAMNYAQDYIVRLYGQFTRTLVPSEHLRLVLESWGLANTSTLNLGVDTESFSPGSKDAELLKSWDCPSSTKLLLYVGRLSAEKNIETLLQAHELLCEKHPGRFHLLVVGDGPLRALVDATAKRTQALTWRSYIQGNSELARYYRSADLFVHPGVCETFGLVVLEAQACGLPCVGIRGSFMDANVMAGLENWASENTSPALAEAVLRMVELDLPGIGARASKLVHQRFSWSHVFARQWDLYRLAIMENSLAPV